MMMQGADERNQRNNDYLAWILKPLSHDQKAHPQAVVIPTKAEPSPLSIPASSPPKRFRRRPELMKNLYSDASAYVSSADGLDSEFAGLGGGPPDYSNPELRVLAGQPEDQEQIDQVRSPTNILWCFNQSSTILTQTVLS
jgi:hypothetical protein